MTDTPQLDHPWLIAVWPGMGHVALSAGYYLMSKLGMVQFAELTAGELFDVDAVVVKDGLVQKPHRPRSRLFAWKAPPGGRDVIVFIGESQPQLGKLAFCERLIDFARDQGVERLFTFAAMATEMQPGSEARVFAAATQQSLLDAAVPLNVHILDDGHVGGLNGVLLAAAAEKGMPGFCLLGEMPHIFMQLLYPKASLAVLRVFLSMAKIDLDLAELAQHSEQTEHRLGQIVAEMHRRLEPEPDPSEETTSEETTGEEWKLASKISPEDEQRINSLFEIAGQDRSLAFELKSELDRLGLFESYEDRFLDLFKKPE
ncbi:PAC2 family protein [Rubripirellula reticaptiva]|uniref:PAC2 family protein n=1 Tax=Rubripirellula reticaptiva TaxID=2528013 RepID=A0A5C6EDG8_9BACT|nr:PAC2 family protein [Rubripirellula reticaptiva]TWU46680.1 PAC2 family protein [Rubripirellula reticaptiva]